MSKQREALEMILAVGYTSTESPTYKIIKEALAEPARKPLTDEEIDNLELPPNGCTMRELVRVVERAHGIGK